MIKDFSDIKRYYARTSQTCGVNGDETLTGVMTLGIFLNFNYGSFRSNNVTSLYRINYSVEKVLLTKLMNLILITTLKNLE